MDPITLINRLEATARETLTLTSAMLRHWRFAATLSAAGAILGGIGGFSAGHIWIGASVGAAYGVVCLAALLHEAKSFGEDQ